MKNRIFKRFVSIKPQQGVEYVPAVENVKQAGMLTREQPKQINETVQEYARKAKHIPKRRSRIKDIEEAEDEEDTKEYLKGLKR